MLRILSSYLTGLAKINISAACFFSASQFLTLRDGNGRFIGLDAATGSKEEFSIAKSAVELMLFWVNEQYPPVCESVEVKLNE